jgi:Type IV secretion system pilin
MKKKLIVLGGMVLTATPFLALAQIGTTGSQSTGCDISQSGNLFGLLCRFGQLFNSIVPVLIALGVLFFVWGVVQYVIADDEEAKSAGRNRMIYGIIGLAVIIGVWGLVNFLRNTFGLNNNTNIQLPTVPVVIPGSS